MSKQLWNRRFNKDGHLWGDAPSMTATILMENLSPNSLVCDIGSGYGRDLIAMIKAGHQIVGIEEVMAGLKETIHQIKTLKLHKVPILVTAEDLSAFKNVTTELQELSTNQSLLQSQSDFGLY